MDRWARLREVKRRRQASQIERSGRESSGSENQDAEGLAVKPKCKNLCNQVRAFARGSITNTRGKHKPISHP